MKWVPGFCPERVFGGAGEGPHVQTNAMLAPSSRRDFSVGNCGTVNSRQKAPHRLPLPQWAYESREKNSPGTGAAPPSRRRFPASGRSFSASVFSATKPDNPGIATDFTLCLQYRRRSKSVPCYTSAAAMGQLLRSGKPRRSNCFCPFATPATHFRQVTASRMRSAFPR